MLELVLTFRPTTLLKIDLNIFVNIAKFLITYFFNGRPLVAALTFDTIT